MPLPKPKPNETRKDFMTRCLSNPTMVKEYKKTDQRIAICSTLFEKNEKTKTIPKQSRERPKETRRML